MEQMVTTLNELKVSLKNLKQKYAKDELTSVAAFREHRQVELVLQQLRAWKNLRTISTNELVQKRVVIELLVLRLQIKF